MKVWITKYALTTGIFEIEADLCDSIGMIKQRNAQWNTYYHGEGRDWHYSKESAIKRALKLRDNKISSLTLKIEKLNKLTFS